MHGVHIKPPPNEGYGIKKPGMPVMTMKYKGILGSIVNKKGKGSNCSCIILSTGSRTGNCEAKMSFKFSFFETLFLFFYRILFKQFRNSKGLHRTVSNNYSKFRRYNSLAHRSDLSNQTLIFNVEGALLKSSSLFPYFMLVACEAGGLFRASFLLASYPFICLVGEEMGLKIMVMICFFGIKQDSFRVGKAVLPKFFLDNVGLEIFEVVKRGGKKVGFSNIPTVMIDSFLRDYLEIDVVVGRELKVLCGYFVGLMEERKKDKLVLKEILGQENNSDVIGVTCFNKSLDEQKLFVQCKVSTFLSIFSEIYPLVSVHEVNKVLILYRLKTLLLQNDNEELFFVPTTFKNLLSDAFVLTFVVPGYLRSEKNRQEELATATER